jgi:predicted transcriptional regulator
MNVEQYLSQNLESLRQECLTLTSNGSKAIVTVKKDGENYVHQVSTVEKFIETIPENKFFKKMRDAIANAVLNKIIPVVVFEEKKARIISLPDRTQ